MKNCFSLMLLFIIYLTACQPTNNTAELTYLQKELAETKIKLEESLAVLETFREEENHPLIHIVYFKLKNDADANALISEIKKLEAIEVLKDLEVGTFHDLGDERAMSEYGVVMEMGFNDEADYKSYQAHPLHFALKEAAGPLLAGPPVTYDFMMK